MGRIVATSKIIKAFARKLLRRIFRDITKACNCFQPIRTETIVYNAHAVFATCFIRGKKITFTDYGKQ
jgi:hypothetical protein